MPDRTCLGCRRSAAKASLIRLASKDGLVAVDALQRMPGRGAYICPERKCLSQALRKDGFSRALRKNVAVLTEGELLEQIKKHGLSLND